MDKFHERAIRNLRERHETVITENSERVREHIGYVLKRIEVGRIDSIGLYAEDIAASIGRIRLSVAALETLRETTEILKTSDEPEREG
jgi:hypothetical protein